MNKLFSLNTNSLVEKIVLVKDWINFLLFSGKLFITVFINNLKFILNSFALLLPQGFQTTRFKFTVSKQFELGVKFYLVIYMRKNPQVFSEYVPGNPKGPKLHIHFFSCSLWFDPSSSSFLFDFAWHNSYFSPDPDLIIVFGG